MKAEYGLSNLNKPVTKSPSEDVMAYFKGMADES
jgi:hypothetical protein